jgi:hypothetical protein
MTSVSCFQGSGGYSTTKGFDTIVQKSETAIASFDITGAVEVYLDVRTINNLIGIQKDISNINVTSTSNYYDNTNDILLQDSLVISADMFIAGLNNNIVATANSQNVKSVGILKTMYSDFSQYVAMYFGLPTVVPSNKDGQGIAKGLATLYTNDYDFNPNNGLFDGQAFLDILTDISANPTNAFQKKLSGNIELTNITAALRNAVTANPFKNRTRFTGTTASDPYDRANYGTTDGFLDGDVIYIAGGPQPPPTSNGTVPGVPGTGYYGNGLSDGIVFTLNLSVDPSAVAGNTTGLDSITRGIGAPLVIRLRNVSACFSTATFGTVTNNSITINLVGTYNSIVVQRSSSVGGTTQSTVYTPFTAGQLLTNATTGIVTYTDSTVLPYTNYAYFITPVDINGNKGITPLVPLMTTTTA